VIAYLDTSVVLRVVLEQAAPLREWDELYAGVSSTLLRVECQRSLDRLWHNGSVAEEKIALKSAAVELLIRRLDLVELDERVLAIAARPFPVPLGTLDSLHLATAIMYRDAQEPDERPIYFATHDAQLARAAKAMHFDVIGVTL
jgi:predicted nucleic acid-binding protein